MPKMTKVEWLEQLEDCGGDISQDQLIQLVFEQGPNALWTDTVNSLHHKTDGMYNYFANRFPVREWKDWSGTDQLSRNYHHPFLPLDFSIFARSMEVCDPGTAQECDTTYCPIPRGGISNMPSLKMFKWGFKTDPMCIADIRTSAAAKEIAMKIVNERFAIDEMCMNNFYTMAILQMLGHKYVLEVTTDEDGNVVPVTNANPRNPLQGYRFSYMQPLFPAVGDISNITTLDLSFLDEYGRTMSAARDPHFITKGPRGESIWEFWHSEDWYRQETFDNAEWIERMKYTMKTDRLPGYRAAGTQSGGEREVIGNFLMRQNDSLPRFTESSEGGLTVVQQYNNVAVDIGYEPVHNHREWTNAPFLIAMTLGKEPGEILTRPTISQGIEGMPIQPIAGNGPWIYRNDFDPTCNDDLNKPHFRKRYEMGFRLLNPDSGRGFIYRAKRTRLRPIQTCDLRPIFKITPASLACDILTVGCNPNNTRENNNILDDSGGFRKVRCSSAVCGDSTSTIYRVELRREDVDAISPGQNPLNCDCGDTIQVFIGDADGDTAKTRDAVILQFYRPNIVNPKPMFLLKLASALSAGECIQFIGCKDSTPTVATVIHCTDSTTDDTLDEDQVRFVLDSAIPCNVGASINISYYDEDNVIIDSAVSGTIISIDPETMTYVVEATDLVCDMKEGQVTVKLTCA